MAFIIHFYITFGTNLLTGGPAHIDVLLPVSVFIGIFGVGFTSRGPPGCPRDRGPRPREGGAPPTLVGSPGLLWPNSFTPWPSSGPKISSVKFQVNWTPFDFPFL